jgi:hypothetical protein
MYARIDDWDGKPVWSGEHEGTTGVWVRQYLSLRLGVGREDGSMRIEEIWRLAMICDLAPPLIAKSLPGLPS